MLCRHEGIQLALIGVSREWQGSFRAFKTARPRSEQTHSPSGDGDDPYHRPRGAGTTRLVPPPRVPGTSTKLAPVLENRTCQVPQDSLGIGRYGGLQMLVFSQTLSCRADSMLYLNLRLCSCFPLAQCLNHATSSLHIHSRELRQSRCSALAVTSISLRRSPHQPAPERLLLVLIAGQEGLRSGLIVGLSAHPPSLMAPNSLKQQSWLVREQRAQSRGASHPFFSAEPRRASLSLLRLSIEYWLNAKSINLQGHQSTAALQGLPGTCSRFECQTRLIPTNAGASLRDP